ncbi:MAG: hypothetical protein ACUVQ8_02990 [Nitrososphaeria archaeon]
MKVSVSNEREKKLVVSSLIQFLYYKKAISFEESSSLLKKVRSTKAEKMLELIYNNKFFNEQISIARKYSRYWFTDTAWRIRMRREIVSAIESACLAAAFLASRLKYDCSNELVYANSTMSETLSIMLSMYSEINCFCIEPSFDISLPENLLIPVVLGFETNLEIARKEEVPYLGMNILYKIVEVKRKMAKVYIEYCRIVQERGRGRYFSNRSDKRVLKKALDNPALFSISEWRNICMNSLCRLNGDLKKTFGDLVDLKAIQEDLPPSLSASIAWFLKKKDVEETVDVVTEAPVAEGAKEDQLMYG